MDKLELINQIIEAHQVIRKNVSALGKTVADREALFKLEREQYSWTPGQPGEMGARQQQIEETLQRLDQGLRSHFALEEQYLPPLFGDLLMKGMLLEHHNLLEKLGQTRAMIAGKNPEFLSRAQLLEQQSSIRDAIGSLSRHIEDHASSEEVIFDMLKMTLEANPRDREL